MWNDLLGFRCVLCRRIVTGRAADRQLCASCLADLPWLVEPEITPPTDLISRQIAPLAYAGAPRTWVLGSKHDGGLVAARILGVLLAEALEDAYPPGTARPSHLIPVPLSRRRLIRRGHNQAVLIAAPVGHRLGCVLVRRGIHRRRHTPFQPGLDPARRRRNVQGAFESRRRWHGETVAIVDDVVTTGATAAALAEALIEAGAGAVHLWSPTLAPAT
ncbi:MAG: ComF family protein [Pseudomonadales bacterium]